MQKGLGRERVLGLYGTSVPSCPVLKRFRLDKDKHVPSAASQRVAVVEFASGEVLVDLGCDKPNMQTVLNAVDIADD